MKILIFIAILFFTGCGVAETPQPVGLQVINGEVRTQSMYLSSGEAQEIEFHFFTIDGQVLSVLETGLDGEMVEVGPYLKSISDRGEDLPLSVYKEAFPGAEYLSADFRTNCHGFTFGRTLSSVLGDFWFNDSLAMTIFESYYQSIDQPEVGDAFLIKNPQGQLHSGVISSIEGGTVLTMSKLGEGRLIYNADLKDLQTIYGDHLTYYRLKPP